MKAKAINEICKCTLQQLQSSLVSHCEASPENAWCLVTTAGGILATLQVGNRWGTRHQATSHPADWYRRSLSIHVFRHQPIMILLIRCVTYSDQVLFTIFWPILLFMLAFRLGAAPPLSVMGGCVCGYCGLCGWLRHGCILQSDLMTTILFIYPHQLTPPQLTVSMP